MRWYMWMFGFDFEIKHIAGERNGLADGLSRLIKLEKRPKPSEEKHRLSFIRSGAQIEANKELQKAIRKAQKESWPDKINDDDFIVKDEEGKALIPKKAVALQKEIFGMAHCEVLGGHKGINATIRTIKNWKISWKNMKHS
ncbi:hypothetical protein ADUPG1_005410, partial [Aduncisulcus paluster]